MTVSTREPSALPAASPRGRKGGGGIAHSRRRLFVPFVGPALAFYTLVFVVPTFVALWISLHQWAGSGPMKWVGVRNYTALVHDKIFLHALVNTLELLVVVGIAIFVLSFAMTLILRDMAGRKVARSIIFFPHLINALVYGALIGFVFNPGGLVNTVLKAFGVTKPPGWLAQDNLFSLIMVAMIFMTTGYYTTIIMAGVDRIPLYYYEDCAMAGANAWQRMRHVILPLTWDVFGVCAVLWTISSVKIFEIIWIFGASSSAPPTQTWTVAVYTYATGFAGDTLAYGAATAAAIVSLVLVSVLVVLLRRVMRRDVIEF